MTLEEVKAWISENMGQEEVKSYVEGLITTDRAKLFLETDEGRKILQPKLDSYFTKSLESWKTNNLDKLVNEKVLEQNPEETPQEKRIKALEQSLSIAEKARNKQDMEKKALKKLSEKKYPVGLVDFITADSDEELNGKVETLFTTLEGWAKERIDEKYKGSGRTPFQADQANGKENPWAKDTWNLTKQGQLTRDNPDLARYFRENTRSK